MKLRLARSNRLLLTVSALFCLSASNGCATPHDPRQSPDLDWSPVVSEPEFAPNEGPRVLVDAAHGNFHTIDGRFAPFAELLRLDGFRIASAQRDIDPAVLSEADIFVISNALFGGHDTEWTLPIPSAFTADEIDGIVDWVYQGGALLLIADHMPFPGATEQLAQEFGAVFYNGFALPSATSGGHLKFTRESGLLHEHAITAGRVDSERINSVCSFTGQAFRHPETMQALLQLPDDWVVLLPAVAWEFDERTPQVSARGLAQGGVMKYGAGRVAIFGEAAMFTAQASVSDGEVLRIGMNNPCAIDNAQFVLNTLRWLSGRLDDSGQPR